MSSFERIERRMPELMSELAQASVPDYFDDMLRQTGRARQRPAWASPERWLPMDVVARPVPARAPALRPLLVLLLIGILIAAGLALYAGSQRTKLPEPFGPARNGLILTANADQDIVSIDPVTGSTQLLVSGPTQDIAPWLTRDGQHFMFVRLNGADVGSYWLANADGSDARAVVVLHYYFDLSVPEVAATIGVPVGTAKSRLNRALSQLRSHFAELEPESSPIAGGQLA